MHREKLTKEYFIKLHELMKKPMTIIEYMSREYHFQYFRHCLRELSDHPIEEKLNSRYFNIPDKKPEI